MQVLEASVLGARVVIADCPSKAYLPSLLRATVLHGSSTEEGGLAGEGSAASTAPVSGDSSCRDVFVVHLADAEVVRLPKPACVMSITLAYLP